jgi:hypothetical protein
MRAMYEHRREKLLSRALFMQRLARHGAWALLLVLGSLVFGMVGFELFCGQEWPDALLNSAMLLGGMGPVGRLEDSPIPGKLFAAFFALYAGLVFLVVAGLVFAPVFHRLLHRFHLEISDEDRGR